MRPAPPCRGVVQGGECGGRATIRPGGGRTHAGAGHGLLRGRLAVARRRRWRRPSGGDDRARVGDHEGPARQGRPGDRERRRPRRRHRARRRPHGRGRPVAGSPKLAHEVDADARHHLHGHRGHPGHGREDRHHHEPVHHGPGAVAHRHQRRDPPARRDRRRRNADHGDVRPYGLQPGLGRTCAGGAVHAAGRGRLALGRRAGGRLPAQDLLARRHRRHPGGAHGRRTGRRRHLRHRRPHPLVPDRRVPHHQGRPEDRQGEGLHRRQARQDHPGLRRHRRPRLPWQRLPHHERCPPRDGQVRQAVVHLSSHQEGPARLLPRAGLRRRADQQHRRVPPSQSRRL